MYVHGKKVFLDTENTITIYNKLAKKFKDVSILESVIGGDNKGRYSIILFNVNQNIEIFHNYALINNRKKIIKSPDFFRKIESLFLNKHSSLLKINFSPFFLKPETFIR